MAFLRKIQGLPHLVHLVEALYKRRYSPSGGLKPRTCAAGTQQFICLDGRSQALEHQGPGWPDHYLLLHETQCLRGDKDGSWRRHLLHASREMRRHALGGVVHMKLASDRAHEDLAGV